MARQFDGTNDGLQTASALNLSGTQQVSLSFWYKEVAYTGADRCTLELSTDTNNFTTGFGLFLDSGTNNVCSIFLRGQSGGGVPGYQDLLHDAPADDTWSHFFYTFDKSTSPSINGLLNGAALTGVSRPSTANVTGTNFGSHVLYMGARGGSSLWGEFGIAELGIYVGTILTAADAAQLAKGFAPPLVRPDKLTHYWPLAGRASPETGAKGGIGFTVSGATASAHPRQFYPTRQVATAVPAAGGGGTAVPVFLHHYRQMGVA